MCICPIQGNYSGEMVADSSGGRGKKLPYKLVIAQRRNRIAPCVHRRVY